MKRVFLVLWAVLSLITVDARAVRLVRAPAFSVDPNQSVAEELWVLSDGQVDLQGLLNDDVVAIGKNVNLEGSFQGDVFALAREVRFKGSSRDQLRLFGQTVFMQGHADRNVMLAASSIEVDGTAQCAADVVLLGEQVIFKGTASNLYIIAKEATVHGVVRGRLRIGANDLVIMPGTEVGGDIVYTSPNELVLDRRVVVKGTIRRSLIAPGGFQQQAPTFQGLVAWTMFLYVGALVAGTAFCALFPGVTGLAVQNLRRRLGWCGLAGFVAFGLLPMVGAVLLFTVIGIPLGLLLLTVTGLLGYLSKLPVALWIGSVVLRLRGPTPLRSVFAALVVGLFVLYGFSMLPYIGSMVAGITLLLGLGSLLTAIFTRDRALPLLSAASPPIPQPPPVPQPPPISADKQANHSFEQRED